MNGVSKAAHVPGHEPDKMVQPQTFHLHLRYNFQAVGEPSALWRRRRRLPIRSFLCSPTCEPAAEGAEAANDASSMVIEISVRYRWAIDLVTWKS